MDFSSQYLSIFHFTLCVHSHQVVEERRGERGLNLEEVVIWHWWFAIRHCLRLFPYHVSSQCGWQPRQSSHSQPPKAPLSFISGHCSQTQTILLGAPKAWRVGASKFGGEGSEAKGRCGKSGRRLCQGPNCCLSLLPSLPTLLLQLLPPLGWYPWPVPC